MDQKPGGNAPWDAFGTYPRAERHLARLSLRQLAELTRSPTPILARSSGDCIRPDRHHQILGRGTQRSTGDLLAHAADIVSDEEPATTTQGRFGATASSTMTRRVFLAVYRSMVDSVPDTGSSADGDGHGEGDGDGTARLQSTAGDGDGDGQGQGRPPQGTVPVGPSDPRRGTRCLRLPPYG